MSDHTLSLISHYQKKLEKYAATGENEKLLCCIHKLKYLPVTVNHLEVTGVGKSINGLRHQNGLIGEKARALVQKWKLMVAEEEEQQLDDNQSCSPKREENNQTSRSQSNTPHAEHEEEYDPSDEGDRLQIQEEQMEEDVENISYNPGGCKVEDDDENINGCYNPITSREDYLSIGSEGQGSYNPTVSQESDDSYNPIIKQESYEPSYISPERQTLPNGDSYVDKIKKEKSSHRSRDESKHKKKKHKSKHDQENKHKSSENDSSLDHHKRSKHKSSKNSEKKKDKESSKQSSSHSSSSNKSHSSSHRNKQLDIEVSALSANNHGSSSTNVNVAVSSPKKRHRETEEEPDSHISKKSKTSDKQKEKKSHKSSKSSKDEHKSSKKKKEDLTLEASCDFGAALMGLDEAPSSKKKKKKKSKEKEKREAPEVDTPPKTPDDISPKTNKLNLDYRDHLPELPSNFDLEASAPQLMTHYKPLPHVPQRSAANKDPFTSSMTNEEALNYMFTSKSSKQRRIYTGKARCSSIVPSLFDICIRVLQENIDALETTGNIPYDTLRPVFEKANPQQLMSLEDYNPYLLEDTDELWAIHCKKHFKNKKREEMESWRDMFMRSTDEHNEKMRTLTESLQKKYVTKAPPKRTTQLAYINTAAKPPKSVARAQARYGTASASAPVRVMPSKSTDHQNAASSSSNGGSSSSNTNAVPKPDRPFPNKPPAMKKPKVAPLMGKARQLMKKVCRR